MNLQFLYSNSLQCLRRRSWAFVSVNLSLNPLLFLVHFGRVADLDEDLFDAIMVVKVIIHVLSLCWIVTHLSNWITLIHLKCFGELKKIRCLIFCHRDSAVMFGKESADNIII